MSSAVHWIKITTDIFEDEKILLIDTLPNSDSILMIWFKLLCLAGKQNNKGVFMFNKTPYTPKMLSTILRRDEETITNALQIFEEYGMIAYVDNVITITNWGKHQNLDKLEANTVYMRNYMRDYRKKQKEVAEGKDMDKVNGKVNHKVKIKMADIDINKDIDKELEKDKEKDEERIDLSSYDDGQAPFDYQAIINIFNSVCKSLPKVVKLTEKRKKSILEVVEVIGDTSFEKLFEKIEKSDFLTGRKGEWQCNFDWIMQSTNVIKILEGNYDNRKGANKEDFYDSAKYINITMEV